MGYEVVYKYYDRNEDGPGYNVTETKELKRKIGTPYEEVPYEKLAGAIMAQMARRDIMVQDVEVYEYTKKKVSFKETKGGVIIGSRKYSFDDCGAMGFTEMAPEPEVLALPAPTLLPMSSGPRRAAHVQMQMDPQVLADGGNVGDQLYFKTHRPIRQEMFAPKDKALAHMAQQRKMPFTVGKIYPIYEEKAAPGNIMSGMVYTVKDDSGCRQLVPDKFFDMVPNLYAGELFNEDPMASLTPSSPAETDMPDVSRMRAR